MPRIIIRRKNQWTNRARSFGIYVDGNKLGSVRNGQTEEFQIPEGALKLKARVDWCGSNELPLANGVPVQHFIIGAYRFADLIVVVELLILIAHFIASFNYGINYVIFFAVPLFLVGIYYITIGKNRYLLLEEDEKGFSF